MNLSFKDLLYFDEMLTPKIITVIYWLLLFITVVSGLGTMIGGSGIVGFLGGVLLIVFGAIGARVWCEILIVIFKIHQNLKRIADK